TTVTRTSASSTPCAASGWNRSRPVFMPNAAPAARPRRPRMSEIIKNGRIAANDWNVLRLAETDDAASVALPAGRVIVPLAVWQAQRAELLPKAEAGVVGVWLAGDADPAELADDLSKLQLVAIDFPKFAD